MTKFVQSLVLVAALLVPAAASADDNHYMRDVRRVLGEPTKSETGECGGGYDTDGDRIAKFMCVLWMYAPSGGSPEQNSILVAFDKRTKKLVDAGMVVNGEVATGAVKLNTLKLLHEKMHNAQ